MADPAAGLPKEVPLIGERDLYSEILLSVYIFNYRIGEMVDIDDHFVESGRLQFGDYVIEKRFPSHRNECLRHRVRERLQPGSQACREDQGFHLKDPLNVQFAMGYSDLDVESL